MFSFFQKKQYKFLKLLTGGKSLQEAVLDTVTRFPSATALMLLLSGLWYYMIARDSTNIELAALSVAGVLGVFFAIAAETATEEDKRDLKKRLLVVIAPIVFAAIQYAWARQFEIDSGEYIGYSFLHGAIGLSLVFIGSYWKPNKTNTDYTKYYLNIG